MKKSLKIFGCLLALLVPAGCLAVKKNWLMVLITCCFGDSRPENGGPSTVYEQPENQFNSDVDQREKKIAELLKEQEDVFVDISDLFDKQGEESNNLVNSYFGNKRK